MNLVLLIFLIVAAVGVFLMWPGRSGTDSWWIGSGTRDSRGGRIRLLIGDVLLIGGLIAWFVSTRSKDQALNKARMSQGTLIASGFIAGGALMGVVGAILKFADVDWKLTQWNSSNAASWVGLGMYLALIIYFAVHSLRAKKEE